MLKRALALMIGVLVLGLLMAACGDDGDGNGGEASGNGSAVAGDEGSASGGEANEDGTGGDSSGGDGEGSDEDLPSPSKAAFVKQANQICTKAKQRIGGEVNSAFRGQNNEVEGNAEAITSQILIPGLEAELAELQALGAPAGDEAQVGAILAAIQKIIDDGEADTKTITAQPQPYAAAEKPADAYGISACPLG